MIHTARSLFQRKRLVRWHCTNESVSLVSSNTSVSFGPPPQQPVCVPLVLLFRWLVVVGFPFVGNPSVQLQYTLFCWECGQKNNLPGLPRHPSNKHIETIIFVVLASS